MKWLISHKVGVLNMASFYQPGGGYRYGTNSQEESLFRRTTLPCALDPVLGANIKAIDCYETVSYPFDYEEDGVIFTPGVQVLRDLKYQILPSPYEVDVYTTAAPKNPPAYTDAVRDLMRRKIHTLLLTAVHRHAEVLVLGAFGCGTY